MNHLLSAVIILATSLVQSCNSDTISPLILKGEIRYLADQPELSAQLALFQGDSFSVSRPLIPQAGTVTFLGSLMEQRKMRGDNHFSSRRDITLPDVLHFSFPKDSITVLDKTEVSFSLPTVSIEGMPSLISKGAKRTNFSLGASPLKEKESLIVFFEPEDRSQRPRRIVIAGPSRREEVSLPNAALADVPYGKYSIYLVRQGIIRRQDPGVNSDVSYQYHSESKAVTVAE